MKCPNCGKEIANDSQFCEYCGTKINLIPDNERKPKKYKSLWITLVTIFSALLFGIVGYYQYKNMQHERTENQRKTQQKIYELEQQVKAAQQQAEEESRQRLEEEQKAQQERKRREEAEKNRHAELARKAREEREALLLNEKTKSDNNRELAEKDGYVDLGLPSKTMWRRWDESSELYTYVEAVNEFGDQLPTYEQFNELLALCSFKIQEDGIIARGPNKNSILILARGCKKNGKVYNEGRLGFLWSRTSISNEKAYHLGFSTTEQGVAVSPDYKYWGCSVRLVRTIE